MKSELALHCENILQQYCTFLQEEERSQNTIQKYFRDVKKFLDFVQTEHRNNNHPFNTSSFDSPTTTTNTTKHSTQNTDINIALSCIQKAQVLTFKQMLIRQYAPTSVNSMLAAINHFLSWCGLYPYRVKPLKIQRNTFCCTDKNLSEREYRRLLTNAEEHGEHKLSLLIQTLCATGIRVSELPFITAQAIHKGQTRVQCKNKTRIVFLPRELCKTLKQFCQHEHIVDGSIFCTKNGKPLDRSNIWKMMKRLCARANVKSEKVFPHNLRHLFARTYYKTEKDITRLADLLGHTNVNTTRIYIIETGKQHAKQINRMNLLYQKNINFPNHKTQKTITT